MQTTALATVQQKAVSLREFIQSDKIREQLAMAVPKWLSIDRLLRIVFSTALRNPKILDCSRESILQSVMMCAQLGLEPILGRAYLIPYNNKKLINGQWKKVMECQFQPGYQGLVDLARRSNTISDVFGSVVYEKDEFEYQLGTDRFLIHKPLLIGDPGPSFGAYVVWELKDGTKHPEFMPLHEIHKRRDRSQAYQWAETGDPQKGGGKQDSVWHQWPEDMMLKTVIKHSSKLVPASIEFMQAVSMDNDSEIGRSQLNSFSYDVPQLTGQNQRDKELAIAEFDRQTANLVKINDFLEQLAKSQDLTVDEAKSLIMEENDLDNMINNYRLWEAAQKQQDPTPAGNITPGNKDLAKPTESPSPDSSESDGSNGLPKSETIKTGPENLGDIGKNLTETQKKQAEKTLSNLSWDPETAEYKQRYSLEMIKIMKAWLDEKGIDRKSCRTGRDLHNLIRPPEKPEIDLELRERFNEAWVNGNKNAKLYAGENTGCQQNASGYMQPPVEKIEDWMHFYDEFMSQGVDDPDPQDQQDPGQDPFGGDQPPLDGPPPEQF